MSDIRTRRRLPALSVFALVGAMFIANTANAFASITVARLTALTVGRTFEGMLLESDEGRFSIRIPEGFSNPQESTMPIEMTFGMLDMKTFTATKGQGSVFMMAYIDYPDSSFNVGSEKFLDEARDGALTNMQGKALSQKSISLLGHPGRSMKFAGKSGNMRVYGRVDYYIVRPRLYQVLLLSSSKAMVETPTVTASFATFTITQ